MYNIFGLLRNSKTRIYTYIFEYVATPTYYKEAFSASLLAFCTCINMIFDMTKSF